MILIEYHVDSGLKKADNKHESRRDERNRKHYPPVQVTVIQKEIDRIRNNITYAKQQGKKLEIILRLLAEENSLR